MHDMDRRTALRAAALGATSLAFSGCLWKGAATKSQVAADRPAQPGRGPYGPIAAPDSNGIGLPQGFSCRVLAKSGQTVSGTSYTWHLAPDGGACFPAGDGWIYVSNAEVDSPGGGASALRFDAGGKVTSAYQILANTDRNCAGGATPWGTWLSCEEVSEGRVYETYPDGSREAVVRPAMGTFKHEAAASDPERGVIYLTEDQPDGCFYRFRPRSWGDLSSGTLEVLMGGSETSGKVTWRQVPDPDATQTTTRQQLAGVKKFDGGEGCYYARGTCWFTTKGDDRVWAYDAGRERLSLVYDDSLVKAGEAPLTGVDNITGATSGDLFIAEDGPPQMQINLITPDRVVTPFLQVNGQDESEIAGPAFSPDGTRLYFSSQRGNSGEKKGTGGITYEVTGPFRRV